MQVEVHQIEGRRLTIQARGVETIVDDTVADGGPGDGFRPTELLLGGLGACMIGTMLTFARNQNIMIHGVSMTLEDEASEHPERIGRIRIAMTVRADATDRQVAALERVAQACKIHNTLERPPRFEFDFHVRRDVA